MHVKDLNEKLDKLIASSLAYSNIAIQTLVATLVKEHEASIAKATQVVDASTKSCKTATDYVASLISDAKLFLESLQAAAEDNANNVNATVEKLVTSL